MGVGMGVVVGAWVHGVFVCLFVYHCFPVCMPLYVGVDVRQYQENTFFFLGCL